MLIAITRGISPRISECELTHLEREPIDFDRARDQHRQYKDLLFDFTNNLLSLPAEPDLPDSVFVEDTALVLDELAVVLRPGAESRRPETVSIAKVLSEYRDLSHIKEPGTIDGGDILRIGRDIFVGLTHRSNAAGIEQLRDIVKPHGYRVEGIPVAGCLHLKSAVTQVADDTLLINRAYVDADLLPKMRLIDVDPSEPNGANALWVRDTIIYPAACYMTRTKLREAGLKVRSVDVSELAKAEAGVTCCSLIFKKNAHP